MESAFAKHGASFASSGCESGGQDDGEENDDDDDEAEEEEKEDNEHDEQPATKKRPAASHKKPATAPTMKRNSTQRRCWQEVEGVEIIQEVWGQER